ncbi:MAG: archaeal proteasome endopeptidase complex subunit beta [Pyrodictiaceae archaeon]
MIFDIKRNISADLENILSKALKHSTTTVGLKIKDHVVLAADRRATAGYYVAHKRARKILAIADYMAMTISGLVADAQILAEWLQAQIKYYYVITGKKLPVQAAATILATILNSSKFFPYIVQLILGGYDTAPRLFTLDWFGTLTEEKYVATGSGSPVALGLLEDEYSEDLDLDSAIDLARRAVLSAIKRDSFTGNGVDVVVIGRDGIREYSFELTPSLIGPTAT